MKQNIVYGLKHCFPALKKYDVTYLTIKVTVNYTILNKKTPSNLSQKLILGLTWLKDKSLDNFKDFVLKFYQEELVKKYFDLFPFAYPETYPINQIEYHKNSLIDEFTYQTYQNLEVYTKKWLNEHNQIFAWNHKNILDMINELKEQYPQLSSKDLTTIKQSIDYEFNV